MQHSPLDFPIDQIPSPAYVIDERLLCKNLAVLDRVQQEAGCKILLAQKGFSLYHTYPLIGQTLAGVASSSLFEARLGYEEMGGEVHIFSPAYRPDEFDDILHYCDHIVFNSFSQWKTFRSRVEKARNLRKIECGIRINPEYSEIETGNLQSLRPVFAPGRDPRKF